MLCALPKKVILRQQVQLQLHRFRYSMPPPAELFAVDVRMKVLPSGEQVTVKVPGDVRTERCMPIEELEQLQREAVLKQLCHHTNAVVRLFDEKSDEPVRCFYVGPFYFLIVFFL